MANQIVVSAGAKVRNLQDVIIGTSGVLTSLGFDVANGVPRLDVNGKILVSQLPNSVMEYKGTWNAATNTPTLVNGTGNQGDVYLCNVAGTVDFGAGAIAFVVGDQVIYSGSIWQRASGATGTVTSVAITESGDSLNITGSPITTSGTINIGFNGTNLQYVNGAGNLTTFPTLITSIGLSMPSAFSVANSPLTANGTIAVTGAGVASQYIRGDGTLADFPSSGGGGSSVSYYLNGGTSQGTIGGTTYYEMSKTAVIGTGVDFAKTGDGFIVAFLTDANDPAQLNIPAGNWNYEIYAQMSSNGGTPQMYAELYKYDGTTFTLISTSSNEIIYDGTALNLYTFAMAVPETSLTLTDRLAVKLYATNSGGKTTTIHTQNGHLCQVITTFSTGITALNGLTAQVQYFQTGTSGTDFNISSTTATHTFNIPDASATARGLITTGTQTIAGSKTFSSTALFDTSTLFKKVGSPYITSAGYTSLQFTASGTNTSLYITDGDSVTSNRLIFKNNAGYDYTFPAASGTLALTSDLANYVDLTTAQTIGGTKTFNDATKNNGGIFLQNASSGSLAGYMNLGGLTNGVKFTSGGGISNTFTLPSATGYTFTFPNATGTIALTSDLSSYVPITRTITGLGSISVSGSGDLSANRTISIAQSSVSSDGYLSATDFNTFNNKQSALTNPVLASGTWTSGYLPKINGTYTIGNSNITDTGSLITLGSNSFVNGSLGVGINANATISLRVSKTITSGTTAYGIYNSGTVQSDVTGAAWNSISELNTAASAFTLASFYHYGATQGTIGAGSTITSQFGFIANSSMIGATNNYGFYGNIPSGTNRWNIYMAGTANNYLGGNLGIGNTSIDTTMLRISRAFTSTLTSSIFLDSQASSTATNVNYIITSANTAAATFTVSAIRHISLTQGTFGAGSTVTDQYGIIVNSNLIGATNNYGFFGNIPSGTNRWNLYMAGTAANYLAGVLNIGTTTLSGYTLDVNGTARVQGALTTTGNITIPNASYYQSLTSTATTVRMLGINSGNVAYVGAIDAGAVSTIFNASSTSLTASFYTSGTEKLTINSVGSVGIGTTSLALASLRVAKTMTGGTTIYGIWQNGTVQSDVTASAIGFLNTLNTAASAFTLSSYTHINLQQSTIGAGSSITNQYGVFIDSLTGATNNFGFYGNIASGTNRWNLYMAGTATNYMAGQTGVGTTTLGSYIFNVGGSVATLVNFNSTNASGFYTTYSASGVEKAYIGLGANTISGLAISDFGIVGSANIVIASGSGGTETMRIDSTKRIGIGTGASINASAKVQIDSTTQGFLPPRMTSAQRTAISSPATGLIVYQTDGVEGLWLRTSTGWVELTVV
jgi:hypothetical protein